MVARKGPPMLQYPNQQESPKREQLSELQQQDPMGRVATKQAERYLSEKMGHSGRDYCLIDLSALKLEMYRALAS